METYSSIILEEIYDEDMADIFVTIMSIIGYIGAGSSIAIFLIIFFKSPAPMKKFRLYLLAYVYCNFIMEVDILLYKPIYIPKLILSYPRGLLSPMNDLVSRILIGILFIIGFIILAVFIMMLIERYSAMSIHGSLSIRNFHKHPTFYTYSNLVMFVIWTTSLLSGLFFFNLFSPADETFVIIQNYVIGGEKLLNFQPSLIRVNRKVFKYIGSIFGIVLFFYVIGLIALFYFCHKALKEDSSKYSKKTWENSKMLFKSMCFQLLTMICFIVITLITMLVVLFLNLPSIHAFYFAIALIWTFPIIDNAVIIVTITPYRRFIANKMMWFRAPVSSQIQANQVVIVGISEQSRL